MDAPATHNAMDGLTGLTFPDLRLAATDGSAVNLAKLRGRSVIYVYPRTSPPGGSSVPGWAEIPGAKGCTLQSCGFRDLHIELLDAGADHVFGLSTQSSDYQSEVASRLYLPFALLSDEDLRFQTQIGLPVFEAGGMTMLHRVTLISSNGVIEKVYSNITDPAANAADVLKYLTASRL